MNSLKINKVTCEICFHSDEYAICHKCFHTYIDKTLQFKKSNYFEKYNLKSSIQDIITTYNQKITMFNKKSQRRLKLAKMQKLIENKDINLKIKQNMIILLNDKIRNMKENLKVLKEMVGNEKRNLDIGKTKIRKDDDHVKEIEKNSEIARQYYFNFLITLLFGQPTNFNSFFNKIIQIEEFFETQEYVKPNVDVNFNANTNTNMNKINNRKNSILGNNDLNEFNKIQNVLSISQSGLFFNLNLQKEFDINFEKFIKFKSEILKNRKSIFQLNHYIYSLMIFIKNLSVYLNVSLPYVLDYNDGYYLLTSTSNNKIYSLYLNTSPDAHSENYINEIIQGYIYLDIDLKILINYMRAGFKTKHSKKYKNCYLYSTEHSLFTHDLKDFLNIKNFFPNYKQFSLKIETNHSKEEFVKNEISCGSFEIEIKSDQKVKEDEGFVIINNYYI